MAIVLYKGDPASLTNPQKTYEAAKKGYAAREPADTMLTPAPFNNTYGIFVRSSVAEKDGLETMQQLSEESNNLTFISYSQFQNRSDGYPNVKKNYPATDFKDIKTVNELGLRYFGLETDGQLASDELLVMKDTKHIWPFYYPAPVVRSDVPEKYPRVEKILNEVSASLGARCVPPPQWRGRRW